MISIINLTRRMPLSIGD